MADPVAWKESHCMGLACGVARGAAAALWWRYKISAEAVL